jgi:hypothetical protein
MRRALPPLLALLALLALAAPAGAAERRVPQGWLGATADGPLTGAQQGEWGRMARNGVETVRVAFRWFALQPAPGVLDLGASDAAVGAAAQHGMTVLPVIEQTPGWAATRPGDLAAPPADPATVQAFAAALVARYGPAGTFWAENPSLPRLPIRAWQIFNEPNHTGFWSERPYAPSYVAALRAAAAGIRGADAGATIVLAGLTNRSWLALRQLYGAGARGSFDVVALHPYTRRAEDVLRLVRYARRVMRAHGDAALPIWITELSWPAAEGRKRAGRGIGIEVSDAEQAQLLAQALRLLARAHRRQDIERVLWYTWLSSQRGPNPFDWSGLRRERRGGVVSAPALKVFRRAARRLEGCAKGADARRCA